MKARIAVVSVYGVALGAWVYFEQKQIDVYSQGAYDFLHGTFISIGMLVLPIVVGLIVARWWVSCALLGPLVSLGWLQLSGYVSPWHDGVPPLGIPNLFVLFFVGCLLLLGAGVGSGLSRRGLGSQRPVDPDDDWTWGR